MKHVICVPQQMVLDGNFPTVVSPNPENPEGFEGGGLFGEGAHPLFGADDIVQQEDAGLVARGDDELAVGAPHHDAGQGFVTIMGEETDEKFLENVLGQATDKAVAARVADRRGR